MEKFNIFYVFILATMIIATCEKGPSGIDAQVADGRQNQPGGLFSLASDIINNVIVPAHNDLYQDVKNLKESISKECSDIEKFNRNKLRKIFIKAMRSYHFTESFQIGFIARDAYSVREKIYPWNQANLYSIDREIATRQANILYQYKSTPNLMGFPALEYLIFEDTLVNYCPDCSSSILKGWNSLTLDTRKKDRCHYMEYVSQALFQEVEALRNAWLPVENGNITSSQVYQEEFKVAKEFAIDLTYALNFFDREVKDVRLGIPTGINTDLCLKESCPEQSEHPFSQDSMASLLYSTRGLFSVITGDKIDDNFKVVREGYGYEEWLRDNGHGTLAEEFISRIKKFLLNLKALEGKSSVEKMTKDMSYADCSQTTSENRKVEICALYQDLKKITDLYKNEFLLALDWGRPLQQGGDTD